MTRNQRYLRVIIFKGAELHMRKDSSYGYNVYERTSTSVSGADFKEYHVYGGCENANEEEMLKVLSKAWLKYG